MLLDQSDFAVVKQCHYSLIIMHENPVQFFLVQNCCDLEQKKWKPYNQANPITTTYYNTAAY